MEAIALCSALHSRQQRLTIACPSRQRLLKRKRRVGPPCSRSQDSRGGAGDTSGRNNEPPPRPRQPRPRDNIPAPKTLRIGAAGATPVGRPSRAQLLRQQAGLPEPQVKDDALDGFLAGIVAFIPGFRDVKPGLLPPDSQLPSRRRSPKKRRDALSNRDKKGNRIDYGDWAADIELGDDWDYRPGGSSYRMVRDTRPRYPNTETPRDSFMRPIVDPIGIMDRLAFDRESREQRLSEETLLNRRESRAALAFAGVWLFLVPFGLGYLVSRGIAEPIMTYVHEIDPDRLELTPKMKREGAEHLEQEALRLRLEASIGKAPPLKAEELFHHLQHEAHEFEHEKKEEIEVGIINMLCDGVTIVTFVLTLILRNDGRRILTNTIGRVSQGMSQTGKAFVLILTADVLMGYHSEEGWTAGIEILSEHYGLEVGFPPIAIFVSTVPVILDTAFKYWLFKGLNRIDPSASVTLSEIDRH